MHKEKGLRLDRLILWLIPLLTLALLTPLVLKMEPAEAGWGGISWLAVDVSPGIGGHVIFHGVKELKSYPSYEPLWPGEELTIEAVPTLGYRFNYWSREIRSINQREVYSTSRIASVKAGSDNWITANFSTILPGWLIAVIAVSITVPFLLRWRIRRLKFLTQTGPYDNGAL